MVFRLNPQQQAIVEARDKNIIVSASAGTGKTRVLISRLMDYLIQQKISIDRFLVVSFTEAAAMEIKDRMSLAIRKALDDSINEEDRAFFAEQLVKMPLASISTIHSFCLEVIRKHGYICDIDPDVAGRVGDEGMIAMLQEKALDEVIDFSKYNELIYTLCDRSEDISSFRDMIIRTDRFIANLEDYDKWKKNVISIYDSLSDGRIDVDPVCFDKILGENLMKLRESYYKLCDIYDQYLKKTSKPYIDMQAHNPVFRNLFDQMNRHVTNKDYDSLSRTAYELTENKLPAFRAGSGLDDEVKKERKLAKDEYDQALKYLAEFSLVIFANRYNRELIMQILELAENYRTAFNRLKKANGIIHFDDMLVMAREILEKNDGRIAGLYRDRFQEIMVDEYQDTNQNQENIIRLIAKDNNVFRVGDIKQSIYRFQNAKPQIMKNLISNKTENDEVLPLQINYRSYNGIIEFSNHVFKVLMNIEERNFSDSDRLLPDPNRDKVNPEKIQLITVPHEGRADRKTYNIAAYIASEIVRLKKEKNLKWSDFAILVRNNARKILIRRVLKEHNVPCYTLAKSGFFADVAVSNVMAILKLILSDSSKRAFAVLSGPMFRMPYELLALKPELYDDLSESSSSPLAVFIRELREYEKNHSLSDLMDKIYGHEDFYMEKISSVQRSNLDSLYQMVLDFERESSGLGNLINYLSLIEVVDREEASSVSRKDDVVQIMTVHQSKGLEFEYVFMADVSFGTQNDRRKVKTSENYGISFQPVTMPYKIQYANPYSDLIADEENDESAAEEIRVLYVALTRPVRQLYMVNAAEFKEPDELNYDYIRANGYLNVVKAALSQPGNSISSLYEVKELDKAELMAHEMVADPLPVSTHVMEKYSTKEMNRIEKVLTPNQLEERKVSPLYFHAGTAADRGTLMHEAVELLGLRPVTYEDFDKLPFALGRRDRELVMGFYKDEITVSLFSNENYNELPFAVRTVNGVQNGVIDLLSVSEDEVFIIDFKSDRNVDEQTLIDRYTDQLTSYYRVVRQEYPDKKMVVYIYSFELRKYINVIG